jgi:hypothetical protein
MIIDLPIPDEANFEFAYLRRWRGISWWIGLSVKQGVRTPYGSSLACHIESAEHEDPVIACNLAAAKLLAWIDSENSKPRPKRVVLDTKPVRSRSKPVPDPAVDDLFDSLMAELGGK